VSIKQPAGTFDDSAPNLLAMTRWIRHSGLLKYDLDHILYPWFNATMNLQNRLALTTDAPTRRQLVAAAVALAGCGAVPIGVRASAEDGISHTGESIHQEPVFQASRKRVYEALTDVRQFDKIVQLSGAMQSGMALGKKPTEISHQLGGAFTLFGGHITGRALRDHCMLGSSAIKPTHSVSKIIAHYRRMAHPFGQRHNWTLQSAG